MATLAEALYELPTNRLRALAVLREMDPKRLALMPDKRQLVQYMAGELNKPASIARAVLRCSARQLRLLQLILSLDGRQAIAWKDVVEAAGGPRLDQPLDEVLQSLATLGLVFRVGSQVLVLDGVRQQVPTSLSDHYTIARCLQNYDAPTVKRIAERLGLEGGTKSANLEAITRHLLNPGREFLSRLNLGPEERSVLEYVIQSGGAATAVEVASSVLKSTNDFFRYDWQNRWKMGKEKNAIDRLLACGLLFVVSYAYGFNLFLVMPGDLLRALTGEANSSFWTSPPPEPSVVQSPPVTATGQSALIRDVVGLFGFVSTQEAARTNTGYIHKTSLKYLARTLSIQSERYAAFLYAVCREAGLIAPSSEKQIYAVTEKGRKWLTLDALEQQQALFTAWRGGDFWAEMYSDPLKRASEYRPHDAIQAIRNAALELVAVRREERFLQIDSLTDVLSYRYPLLLSQSTHTGGELVPSPANFMRLLLAECLYWLGLVELGWSGRIAFGMEIEAAPATQGTRAARSGANRADTPAPPAVPDAASYRLTSLGAYLLEIPDAAPPEEPPTEDQFVLQANAEIFVPPYLEPTTLYHLLMVTEIPAKTGTGNVVSLTRESIRRALDMGISVKDLTDFLRTHARTGIPQNVEYLIREIGERHGHIHVGRAQMYVQVDSPMVLKELQARRELKDYFVRSLGDTVAILSAPDPDKLLKDLRKAGYLPISDDAPRASTFQLTRPPAKPARSPEASPSSKPMRRAASVDTTVDWERIAREDGHPWREANAVAAPIGRPEGAVQDKGNIRNLILNAIRSSQRMQIAYSGHVGMPPQVQTIEPVRVMGNFVIAFLPVEMEEVTLNINRIQWAKPTGEVFSRQ